MDGVEGDALLLVSATCDMAIPSNEDVRSSPGITRLAEGERDVAVLDHVLDLAAHGEGEEDDEIDDLWRFVQREPSKGTRMARTRTGQKTGTSKMLNQVQVKAMAMARVLLCQNLNSGSRRMKGRNSSSFLVGRVGSDFRFLIARGRIWVGGRRGRD